MIDTNEIGLSAYLKKDKVRADKTAPVYFRINVNRTKVTFATKIYILPDRWETTKQLKVTRDPVEKQSKLKLDEIRSKLVSIHGDYSMQGKNLTAKRLLELYLNPDEEAAADSYTLLQLFEVHNKKFWSKVKVGKRSKESYNKFKTVQDHLKEFLKSYCNDNDILDYPLDKLNLDFMESFELYLRTNGVGNNTTMKYCQFFSSMINTGTKKNWLSRNPFKEFEYEFEDTITDFLTNQQLQSIIDQRFDSERLSTARDIFLFSCFTSYAPIDARKLKMDNITRHIDDQLWIFNKRSKTGVDSNVPMLPQIKDLIQKYQKHPVCIATGKLLPFISGKCMNEYLKEIGEICKIPFELHYYVARHTFATLMISMGVSMESVSKMMGHKRIVQTQHYAKIVENKVGKEMVEVSKILKTEFILCPGNSTQSWAV